MKMIVYCAVTGNCCTAVFESSGRGYSFGYAFKSRESSKLESSEENKTLSSNLVDWNGFKCPWCNVQENHGYYNIILCHICGRLTCVGSLQREGKNKIRHYCVSVCGNDDLIRGEPIKFYDASKSNSKGN